jgi:hypothetical protein
VAPIAGEEERCITAIIGCSNCGILATSPASVYSFPHGGNKLFNLSLFKFQEKSQVKIGMEKLPDNPKKCFLGNSLADRALHAVFYQRWRTKDKTMVEANPL